MSDKEKKTVRKEKSGRDGIGLVVASVFLAVIAVMMLSTTLILVVGMIPTIVAYFVDTSKQRSLGPTVFYLNFSGVFPVLLKLWHQGPNMNNAMGLLMDPFMLLLMLAPAGLAWLLYMSVPIMVSGLLRRRAEIRIQTLESDQKKLIEQWGQEVTGLAARPDKPDAAKASKPAEESFTA